MHHPGDFDTGPVEVQPYYDSREWTGKTTDELHHKHVGWRIYLPVALLVIMFVGLGLLLGGCALATKVTNPVNQTQVYQLGNAYGVVQSAAVTYASFPVCNEALGITKLCRTVPITKLLAQYDAAFNTAYAKLEAFVRNPANYPGLSLTQLYNAAWDAYSTFKAAAVAYHIGVVQP